MILDKKITDAQLSASGVVSAPDKLTGTAAENKAVFDRLVREAVATNMNGLIDDLAASTGAANIGANLSGAAGETIQDALSSLQDTKVDKVAGKALSTNDYTTAEKTKLEGIEENANNYSHPASHSADMINETDTRKFVTPAEKSGWSAKLDENNVLTKTNTTPFTPTGDYQPATKKYADELALSAGAVTSVFGRSGAVIAQAGDYTPQMVGARPDTWMPTPGEIGAATVAVYTATLTAAGWSQSAPYTQTVSIEGITSDMTPVVDIVLSDDTNTALSELEAYGLLSKIQTSTGEIVCTCLEDVPTVNINLQMQVVK